MHDVIFTQEPIRHISTCLHMALPKNSKDTRKEKSHISKVSALPTAIVKAFKLFSKSLHFRSLPSTLVLGCTDLVQALEGLMIPIMLGINILGFIKGKISIFRALEIRIRFSKKKNEWKTGFKKGILD